MAGYVGHTGGLTNPRPWRGRCRAGYSNTGGPPLPRKRAPLQKKVVESEPDDQTHSKRRQGKALTASKDMRSRRIILNDPPNRNARTGSYHGKTAPVPMHNAYTWRNPGGPIGSPAGHQTAGYATAKSNHGGKHAGTNGLSLIHI